jgi:hypothetical protein
MINHDHIATTVLVYLGAKLTRSCDSADLPIPEGAVTIT